MEFELNREQLDIQKAVREFVKGEFKKEVVEALIEAHAYPEKIWKKAAELGFIGIHFPEQYSGWGWGALRTSSWPKSWPGATPRWVPAC